MHSLEQKFQRELYQARWLGFQYLIEGRRTDVAVGYVEVGVIQNIEKLRPELELLGFGKAEVLGCGEIPVCVTRSHG